MMTELNATRPSTDPYRVHLARGRRERSLAVRAAFTALKNAIVGERLVDKPVRSRAAHA